MKKVFWAVKWGHEIRIAWDKTTSPHAAAKECYGMATGDMMICNLGSRIADIRNIKKKVAMMTPDKWTYLIVKGLYARKGT